VAARRGLKSWAGNRSAEQTHAIVRNEEIGNVIIVTKRNSGSRSASPNWPNYSIRMSTRALHCEDNSFRFAISFGFYSYIRFPQYPDIYPAGQKHRKKIVTTNSHHCKGEESWQSVNELGQAWAGVKESDRTFISNHLPWLRTVLLYTKHTNLYAWSGILGAKALGRQLLSDPYLRVILGYHVITSIGMCLWLWVKIECVPFIPLHWNWGRALPRCFQAHYKNGVPPLPSVHILISGDHLLAMFKR